LSSALDNRPPETGPGDGLPTCTPRQRWLYGSLGAIALVVLWQVLSIVLGEVIIASPWTTVQAFVTLLRHSKTWMHILTTLQRLVVGLLIGSGVGIILGLVAGLNVAVRLMLEPLRWVVMTVPAVIFALVAMLWFGMGSKPVVFVAAIVTAPYTYVNIMEGLLAIDEKLIEMGRSFRLSRRMMLTEIYLPGIGSSLIAALTLTVGMGIRVVVLAELMSAHDGIGHAFSRAWTHLNTPGIFAWLLASLLLLGILEFAVLRPLKKRQLRWKADA
jgi:NitT/TauT family transport system permease protein